MRRRDFFRALAGVPLLGRLATKPEEAATVTVMWQVAEHESGYVLSSTTGKVDVSQTDLSEMVTMPTSFLKREEVSDERTVRQSRQH